MKTLSAQVIGFTAGSPTTYTTQVHLDGETWTVPIRYSTFRDFYIKIDALEPNFNFDFPKKGGFFSSSPPAQRQVQLDAFMKKSVAHFCERQFPQNVLDLLDDLLEISAHVVKRQETVEPDTEDSASEQEEDDGDVKSKCVTTPTAVLASVPEVETEATEVAVETVEIAVAPAAEVVVEEVVVPAVAPVEEAKSASVEEVKPVEIVAPVEVVEPVEEPVVEQVKSVKLAVTAEVEVTTVTPKPAVEVAAAPVVVDTPAAEEAEPIAAEVVPVTETVIVEAPVEVEAEPVVELKPVAEPVVVEVPVEVAPAAVAAAFEKIVESVKLTLETPSLPEAAPLSSTSTSTEPPSPTAAEKKKQAKQLSEMQKRMRNQKRKEKRKKKSNMKVSAGKSHHAANGIEFDSDDDVLVRVQQPQRKH